MIYSRGCMEEPTATCRDFREQFGYSDERNEEDKGTNFHTRPWEQSGKHNAVRMDFVDLKEKAHSWSPNIRGSMEIDFISLNLELLLCLQYQRSLLLL